MRKVSNDKFTDKFLSCFLLMARVIYGAIFVALFLYGLYIFSCSFYYYFNRPLSEKTNSSSLTITTNDYGNKIPTYTFKYDGITYTCNDNNKLTNNSQVEEKVIIYFDPDNPNNCSINDDGGLASTDFVVYIIFSIFPLLYGAWGIHNSIFGTTDEILSFSD